ncbi:MAG TPA: aspartate--tRNA(Asn) ligase [Candidatus Dormibacteraeota bacterium]|nr:aspartate--tRNA(Asn) ligase [Candidatus Dormibacteraeota bacterium]
MRILSNQLKEHNGHQIHVEGWLHKKRLLGGLTFLNIRDRKGLIQVVVQDKAEVEKLRGLQSGTVLAVDGTVKSEPRAPGGAELHNASLSVLVPVTEESPIEIDKPLSHKAENLDTLFDNRVIGLRNLQEQKIFRMRSELTRYIRDFLYDNDFVEINTPKLVAGAAEGGAEVFKLDYFGKEATLAQSPQLYKQIMVGAFERVFEIAPAYRAELSATTRHVSEVTMLDIEVGFIKDHKEVLDIVQEMVYKVLTRAYKEQADDLKSLNAPDLVIKPHFPNYTMAEIHKMYSQASGRDTTKELDLMPEEEKWICEHARLHDGCEAVYATNLPAAKMKFYHMANEDSTARSADLLFRGVEIATVPQREHRYPQLLKQLKAAAIDPDDPGFSHYLSAFKHGLPAHGGCGFGIDRLTEKVIGLANIKEAILFPRDLNRLTP